MKDNTYKMKEYWNGRAKVYRDVDREGLAAVCYIGRPEFYNRFFARFQEKAFSKLLKSSVTIKTRQPLALDVGCGTGRYLRLISRHNFSAIGVDISATMIEKAKNLASHNSQDLFLMSAASLGFRTSCFDMAYSVVALQHIPKDKQISAIKEVCRVVKQGGFILALEITDMRAQPPHVFAHPEKEWIHLFEKFGCKCRKVLPYEYAFPLRIFERIVSIFRYKFSSPEKELHIDGTTVEPEKISNIRKMLRLMNLLALKFMVYLSYPTEYLCFELSLKGSAQHRAFLFQRS